MYELILDKNVLKFLEKLDKNMQERIGRKIEELKKNPRLGKLLTGGLVSLWSLRVDKYRMVYKIIDNKLVILILDIGHRKNIYG